MFYLLLADGFEEIEALGTLDLLRRGGMEVATCSLKETPEVTGAHGIPVRADLTLTACDCSTGEGVILPGGLGGSKALAASAAVTALLQAYAQAGKYICAICAAPALVLPAAGILQPEDRVTCYPAPEFIQALGAHYTNARAVAGGTLITAAGPGCFTDFAKAILTAVKGSATAGSVFRDALID